MLSLVDRPGPGQLQLLRWLLVSAAAVSLVLGVFLLTRRVIGAGQRPLVAAGLLGLGLLVSTIAGWAHRAWARLAAGAGADGNAFHGLVSLTALTAGLTISLPGSSPAALAACWLMVVAAELTWWGPRLGPRRRSQPVRPASEPAETAPAAGDLARGLLGEASAAAASEEPAADDWEHLPAHLRQRLTYAVDEHGQDVVYGTVRCEFAPGQRQQNVHLAFCPPLARVPELSLEQSHGPVAKIQPVLIETFGACLEVRLTSPSTEPTSVQIHFYALVPAASGQDATQP